MFRASSYLLARSSLLRRNSIQIRILRYSAKPCQPPRPALRVKIEDHPERDHCKPPEPYRIKLSNEAEREACKPPPPPSPPPKDDKWIWISIAAMLVTGGFVVFAKSNPEVRDWLTIYAPWFDDFIAVAYQENMDYVEFAICLVNSIKKQFEPPPPKPIECYAEGEAPPPQPPPPPPPPAPEDPCKKGVEDEIEIEEDPSPCDALPVPKFSDICSIEACMKDLAETIVHNFMTARDACRYYNKLVDELMNQQFCLKTAQILEPEMNDRICLVKNSVESAEKSLVSLEDMTRFLDCGCQLPKHEIECTKKMLQDFKEKIAVVRAEFIWENDKALAEDEHWQNVINFVNEYTSEMSSLYPDVNYETRRPSTLGNIDLLLIHTKKYNEALKEELVDRLDAMNKRVNRAVSTIANKDTEKYLNAEVYKKKQELINEYSKRASDLKCKQDKELQESLRLMKEHHERESERKLIQKEKEALEKLDRMVKEKVAEEKEKFDCQLSEMRSKLETVEYKLQERLRAEREAKRSQALWAAGHALMEATRKGDPVVNVQKILQAIEDNSGIREGDKLVSTVLAAIPPSVFVRGIVPESIIKQRYYSMEDVARKVALVENEGGPLPVYVLSFIQDLLLFFRPSSIPQSEIDNPPKEPPEDLDTFDLLQRANYYIEQGKIAQAVAYVDKMEGASRGAAESWFTDARALLETRQAAATIMAHATALAAKYI